MKGDAYVGPQTPRYRGPVRDIMPEYGNGYVETFCPECGGTQVENIGDRDHFVCRHCGRRFYLGGASDYDDRSEYEISHRGAVEFERVPRWALRSEAWTIVMDHIDDSDDYQNLARDYYGDIYSQYETEEAYLDPASAVSRQNMVADIPYRELETLMDRGYIDGLGVGETVYLPDTPLSITRTRNRKGGRR